MHHLKCNLKSNVALQVNTTTCDFRLHHRRVKSCEQHNTSGNVVISHSYRKTDDQLYKRGHSIRAPWPHPAWLLAFHSELHCQYLTGRRCTALLSWPQHVHCDLSSPRSYTQEEQQKMQNNSHRL